MLMGFQILMRRIVPLSWFKVGDDSSWLGDIRVQCGLDFRSIPVRFPQGRILWKEEVELHPE